MKNKFDRLVYILNRLDRRLSTTVSGLAEEFGVDERSTYRYLESLQAAGFPVYFNREKRSYAFAEGFQLKKTDLDVEEILALAVAKKSLSSLGRAFDEAMEGLERKILDISSPKDRVPASVFVLPDFGLKAFVDISALIKDLARACINHQVVKLTYVSLYSDDVSSREIEPYYLFLSDGFWNLRAYCRLRKEWRTFALDRVKRWRLLNKHFLPKLLGDDVGKEVSKAFGTYMNGEVQEVVVRFSPEMKTFFQRKTWHPSQKNTELEDGWLEVRFETSGLEALKYWLYRWIPHVKVVSPEKLRKEMIEDLRTQLKYLEEPILSRMH